MSPNLIAFAIPIFTLLFLAGFYLYQRRTGRHPRRVIHVAVAALIALSFVVPTVATHAQSVSIDFDASDLDIFFDWFNTIFNAILPIGLLGAGLTAGAMFVWVVAGMLTRAFTNLLRGGA